MTYPLLLHLHQQNMARETILITSLTALVMIYNGCITGFQDISGAFHDPILSSPWLPPATLPLQVFTLTSPSLSLLLGTSISLVCGICDDGWEASIVVVSGAAVISVVVSHHLTLLLPDVCHQSWFPETAPPNQMNQPSPPQPIAQIQRTSVGTKLGKTGG